MPAALVVATVDRTLEAFLLPFAEHLRATGWQVDGLAHGATLNRQVVKAFDRCFDAPWSRNPLSPSSITAGRRLREVVSGSEYDLVWVHTPVAGFVTRFALRNRSASHPVVIYTAHGFHFYPGQHPIPHSLYRLLEASAAPWTDYIVTMNRADYEAALTFKSIKADHIVDIPGIGVDESKHTTDPPRRDAIRKELGLAESDIAFIVIAEFIRRKRHSLIVEALAYVQNPDIRVLFVGDGPLVEPTKTLCQARGLTHRARFLGFRRDVPALLAASDALLVASAHEGLLRSGLEAMASGIPIVGTPTRGIAELIGADQAGWVAQSHRASDLAAVIDAAAADSRERARRGAAGRELVSSRYSLSRIKNQYDDLFSRALLSR